jgi:DNA-binding GntR family transcriptional regulator
MRNQRDSSAKQPLSRTGPTSGRPAQRSDQPPASRTPTYTQIAQQLEEDIVIGRRHPRERLVEQDLCIAFGTHRGDVRLALFELERKGIVQRIPNRGAIVRDLSPEEVGHIYDVREELEAMALRILPLPIARDPLKTLEALQRQHADAIDSGDLLTVHYTNLRFHRTLFSQCGNSSLIETIESLAEKVSSIRAYAYSQAEALANSRQDHAEMIVALRRGRRDQLIKIARRHLKPAVEAYTRAYQQRFRARAI